LNTIYIKKDSPCLFLRLVDFKKNNFIQEHIKTLNSKKCVWLLKMGRPIKKEFIKNIIEQNGVLILKETARNGNKFYCCKISSNDPFSEKLIYPDYYNDLFEENSFTNIENLGNWFKITQIKELSDKDVKAFVTNTTGKDLYECGMKYTQVPQFYLHNNKNLEI